MPYNINDRHLEISLFPRFKDYLPKPNNGFFGAYNTETGEFILTEYKGNYRHYFYGRDGFGFGKENIYSDVCAMVKANNYNPFIWSIFCISAQDKYSCRENIVQPVPVPEGQPIFNVPNQEVLATIQRAVDKYSYVAEHLDDKMTVINSLLQQDKQSIVAYFTKCIEADCFNSDQWVKTFIEACTILSDTTPHQNHNLIIELIFLGREFINQPRVVQENVLKTASIERFNTMKNIKLAGAENFRPKEPDFKRQYTFAVFVTEREDMLAPAEEKVPSPSLASSSQPVHVSPSRPVDDFAPPPYNDNEAPVRLVVSAPQVSSEILEIRSIQAAIEENDALALEEKGELSPNAKKIHLTNSGKTKIVSKCMYKMFKDILNNNHHFESNQQEAKDLLAKLKERATHLSADCTTKQREFFRSISPLPLCPEADILFAFKKTIEEDPNLACASNEASITLKGRQKNVPLSIFNIYMCILSNQSKFADRDSVQEILSTIKQIATDTINNDDYIPTREERMFYSRLRKTSLPEVNAPRPEQPEGPSL
jgi:hypothetical protein